MQISTFRVLISLMNDLPDDVDLVAEIGQSFHARGHERSTEFSPIANHAEHHPRHLRQSRVIDVTAN